MGLAWSLWKILPGRHKVKISIVTDSTSDISTELAKENDIHMIPAILVVNGQSLEDGHGISRHELYRQLPLMKTSPSTAAPSSGTFQKLYEHLLNGDSDQVISIHVSSLLSGMYNTALVGAKIFGKHVHVIDSRHVSLGLGFQVLAAARAVNIGKSLEEIKNIIEAVRQHTHLVAMLDTLEYARRSGRISWARSNLTAFLQIKPFLGIEDGKVIRMGEARTRKKGVDRLYHMLSSLNQIDQLAVLHTNNEAEARQMVETFKTVVKHHPLIINVTSIIGVHVGPNGLGFVAVTQ
jgi:DegV family protein with EDD domain